MAGFWKTLRATMSAAVNTPTPINLDIDGNTVAGIVVPSGMHHLTQIAVSLSASIVAVASSGVNICLRLFGDGVAEQHEIPVGGVREDTTSTGGFKATQPFLLPVDIEVIPSNTLKMAYSLGGVDPGSPEIEVGLFFEP